MFRRHTSLWVPCAVATLVTMALARLEMDAVFGITRSLMAKRSALGGEVVSSDPTEFQHRAMMVAKPLGPCKDFLEVCSFVVAFAVTAKLVGTILEEQRPDMMAALRGVAPQWRQILLFSLKYMVLTGVVIGAFMLLTTSPLTSDRILSLAVSKPFVYSVALLWEGCLAWLLMPAAIRLLQPPESPPASADARKLGVVFAVVTSAAAIALEYAIGRAEAAVVLDSRWELTALTALNSIVENVPSTILFIALALLASQSMGGVEMRVNQEPDLPPSQPVTE